MRGVTVSTWNAFLAFLIAVSLAFPFSCSRKKEARFTWEKAKVGNIKDIVYVTGVVRPRVGAEVKVGSRVSGKVEKLYVNVGDWVNKGDRIAVIEHEDLEALVREAEARLSALKHELYLINSEYPAKIKAQEEDNRSIEARLVYAKKQLSRFKKLRAEDLVSQEEVDRWKKEVGSLSSELEAGRMRLIALKREYEGKRRIKESEIKEARETLKVRRINLSYAFITAPISGIITQISTQEGETVAASLAAPTFVVIVDPRKLEVYLYVSESDIGKIRVGEKVLFKVDAYPRLEFTGHVRKINPKAVIRENMVDYEVIVEIDGPKDKITLLRPEMTAYARVLVREKHGVVVVPSRAVKMVGGRFVVYVKKGKKPKIRDVEVGITEEGKVEITKGLKPGEEVLVSGFEFL